ncbi:MAG: hypothetical protein SGI77_26890 [Pirellulaceae bacterium]|nr:hypothetical protein [Pirellulaceae bacterium]
MLQRILQTLLIDRTLFYALAARIWQAISGPITISLVIASLSAKEAGIYYGLSAVVGIQVFFDLGLLNILISRAAHAGSDFSDRLQLGQSNASETSDRDIQFARMADLIRGSERWFLGTSLLFCVTALAFGWVTLSRTDTPLAWKSVLVTMVVLATCSFALAPYQAILEGIGKRELIYRLRFYQAITGSMVVWFALGTGMKIWSLALATGVQLLWLLYLRYIHEADFFSSFKKTKSGTSDFSWFREIVPLQWRLAFVSLVYFLATQFFVLIVLYFDSDIAAGQLGMTLTIAGAIQMFALAWVQTNFSTTSLQHGIGNREAAGIHWRKVAAVSTTILTLAFAAFVFGLLLLPYLERGLENRFVTPWQLGIYAVGCIANHFIAIQSYYVLSRRGRPFMITMVIGYLSTAFAVWIGGAFHGTHGLLLNYTMMIVLVCLPLHTWAYLYFRKTDAASFA